jgi:uncharacterized protein (TIGR00290 family)
VTGRPKAVVAWSSGKDCAWALHAVRTAGRVDIVGLLTTVTGTFDRVSMHGVRSEILQAQAAALGLPVRRVSIPYPCPNEVYEREMTRALAALAGEGVSQVIFGDLFLADVRAYREQRMAGTGLSPVFPLWGRDTGRLAQEMVSGGVDATIVCLDPRRLPAKFAGRKFDARLLSELPGDVDPCGERGEFHTCITGGPMFDRALDVRPGAVVERDGFVFADLVLGRGDR